jgi:hypothetical protein
MAEKSASIESPVSPSTSNSASPVPESPQYVGQLRKPARIGEWIIWKRVFVRLTKHCLVWHSLAESEDKQRLLGHLNISGITNIRISKDATISLWIQDKAPPPLPPPTPPASHPPPTFVFRADDKEGAQKWGQHINDVQVENAKTKALLLKEGRRLLSRSPLLYRLFRCGGSRAPRAPAFSSPAPTSRAPVAPAFSNPALLFSSNSTIDRTARAELGKAGRAVVMEAMGAC